MQEVPLTQRDLVGSLQFYGGFLSVVDLFRFSLVFLDGGGDGGSPVCVLWPILALSSDCPFAISGNLENNKVGLTML